MTTRRSARTPLEPYSPRNLWLAALGVVAVSRREAGNAAAAAFATAGLVRERLAGAAADACERAHGGTLCGRIEPAYGSFSAEVEARLAPVLDKLGLSASPLRRPARKSRPAAGSEARHKAAGGARGIGAPRKAGTATGRRPARAGRTVAGTDRTRKAARGRAPRAVG